MQTRLNLPMPPLLCFIDGGSQILEDYGWLKFMKHPCLYGNLIESRGVCYALDQDS